MGLLVTGASGFVGQYALEYLKKEFEVRTVSLRKIDVNEVDFSGIDQILHLAGKAHQMELIEDDIYFEVNHRLTVAFAKAAKAAGVSHFVFVSSVKVYGDRVREVLDETSECHPSDPYGQSKLAAENDLLKLQNKNFIVSIVRPPLVYGPKAKGNLDRLANLINRLPFLPFGSIQNERSMVFVGNLTALFICILRTRLSGIFIAGDQKYASTSHLVDTMIKQMKVNKKNRTLPGIFWKLIKQFKPGIYTRLIESYKIDNSITNKRLNFSPPYSFEEGIAAMINN